MKKNFGKLLLFLGIFLWISFLFVSCESPHAENTDENIQLDEMGQYLADFEANFHEESNTAHDHSYCATTVIPEYSVDKRNSASSKYTWSVKKNWTSTGQFKKGAGTRIFPPQWTNLSSLLPAPRLSPYFPHNVNENDFVELVKMALASWQSELDIEMTQVSSGGDLEIDIVANIGFDDGVPRWYGAAGISWGGMNGNITLGLYRRTGAYTEEEYLRFDKPNHTYATMLHEFGHNLGLGHAWDYPDYHPSPAYNYAVMDYHAKIDDTRIRQYLSDWDIQKAQSIWGASIYRPLIELYLPSWQKSFYTSNWNEANILARNGFASDVQNFLGVMYKNDTSYTKPLYRSYYPSGPKHFYSLFPLSGGGYIYEGCIGYIFNSTYSNLTSIHRHYSSYINNHIFTDSSAPPAGYNFDNYYGAVIGYSSMVGYQSEHSNF